MGRTNGRQAKHAPPPDFISKQAPCIQAAHAVPDDVNLLVRKSSEDPITQSSGAKLDTGNWMYPRDENPIARSAKKIRNTPEVGRQRKRTQADPRKSKQPVGQDDWSMQPWGHQWSLSQINVGRVFPAAGLRPSHDPAFGVVYGSI